MKKKNIYIIKIRITAIFFYQFLLNILFTDCMKVHYAGDKNLNRKDAKKVCRNKKNDFLGKTVKTFFLPVQMFYSPMGYLASIMF